MNVPSLDGLTHEAAPTVTQKGYIYGTTTKTDPKDPEGWHAALDKFWLNKFPRQQFEHDVLMWKEAIVSPGDASVATVLNKLFYLIGHYGIAINVATEGPARWVDGNTQNIPIASYLSHGGRIIIQLPVRTTNSNRALDLWNNLKGDSNVIVRRTTSSHRLHANAGTQMILNRKYRFKEYHGTLTGGHSLIKSVPIVGYTAGGGLYGESNNFGMNVALGGFGQKNPWTGENIGRVGRDGHLFLYFNDKKIGECGGIMIGCENSDEGQKSQTGIVHDYRAISEEHSPCGTSKWPHIFNKNGIGSPNKYDAFLIDLSYGFDMPPIDSQANNIHNIPRPIAPPNYDRNPVRTLIYVLKDLIDSGFPNANSQLKIHLDNLCIYDDSYDLGKIKKSLNVVFPSKTNKTNRDGVGVGVGVYDMLYLRGMIAINKITKR